MGDTSINGTKVTAEAATIGADDVYVVTGEGAAKVHADCLTHGLHVSPLRDGSFHMLRADVLHEIHNSGNFTGEYICTAIRNAALGKDASLTP